MLANAANELLHSVGHRESIDIDGSPIIYLRFAL
jgi:hypothetical protein